MARLKLTLGKIKLLEKYVKLGAPMKDIFAASGVPSSTYYHWLSIGLAIYAGDFEDPDIPNRPTRKKGESKGMYNGRLHRYEKELTLYATLYEKMMKADANSRVEMVFYMCSAALAGDCRAASKFLERRDPVNWYKPAILRARAAAVQRQDSYMESELRDLLRILGQNRPVASKEIPADIHAETRNGVNSQPKAE